MEILKPVLVIDVVGLTAGRIGDDTPHLRRLAQEGFQAELRPVLPAVTCPVQSTFLTGKPPRDHGVVGNGWYFRDLSEIWFWRQSNRLVGGPKLWEAGRERDRSFTCAKLFWWYNMYSGSDWSVTPRPVYPADGRKVPGIYTHPAELGSELQAALGSFPFFKFWGPGAGIPSSQWIGKCTEWILDRHRPTLTLVYLPHLDYDFQRHGPDFSGSGEALRQVDAVAGRLIDLARRLGVEVIVLSEYGITPVCAAVSPNRVLRQEGYLAAQRVLSWELLDAGASRAFAVCDHQVAHVYVRDSADLPAVKRCLEAVDGIDLVLDREGMASYGLDHERSGELLLVAKKDRWFDYYYWLDDSLAPDFAPTVDIHRKPGYDPAELFLDPGRAAVRFRILWNLLKKKLGFRYLMDVIPIRSDLVKGSHGRLPDVPAEGPVLIASSKRLKTSRVEATEVFDLVLESVFAG